MNVALVMRAKRAARKAGLAITNKQLKSLPDRYLHKLITKAAAMQNTDDDRPEGLTPEEYAKVQATLRAIFQTPEGKALAKSVEQIVADYKNRDSA